MQNKEPLSPHIQIYKWHISSLVSISHRITGIINIVAITFICLIASLLILGESNYEMIIDLGNYFKNTSEIVNEISVKFNMKDPKKKYHMPLIISPNGYSIWWSK